MSDKTKRVQKKFKCGTYQAQFSRISSPKGGKVRLVFFVYNPEEQDCESFATDACWYEGTEFANRFVETFGCNPAGLKGAGFTVKLGETYWGQNTILAYEADPSFVVPEWARKWMEAWQSDCELKQKYLAARLAADPKFSVIQQAREETWRAIRGIAEAPHLLGCTSAELRAWLESHWEPGMSWENYSLDGWHAHHVIPISRVNVLDPNELRRVCHYSNLRPAWAAENIAAYNTMPEAA